MPTYEANMRRNDEADKRKQGMSDDFRKQKIAETMQTANHIQKATALLLDPNTLQPLPGKEQQVADLRNKYKQIDAYIKNLYNPNFDPMKGSVSEDPIHKLTDKMRLTKPPVQPQVNDVSAITQEFGAQPDTKFKEFQSLWKEATGQELPKDIAEQWAKKQGGVTEPKPHHFSDYAQGLRRFVEAEGGDPDNPTAAQEEAFRKKRTADSSRPKDRYAWKRDAKTHKLVSVKLDEKNQIIPGTENADIVPPPGLDGRITTSNYHYFDDKGQLHQIQETRTSMPASGGGGSSRAAKPPGQQKKELDKIIGFKGSKDYNDTKTAYEAAVDRTDTMDKNLQNGLQGDQQAMLSLVANHIGMTLGAQRGARITRAVWDEAISSTPWLAKVSAKFSDDGYLSGVTLAPEQMRQMVRLAHEKTQTLKDHLSRLDKERGATPSGTGAKTSPIVVTPEDMK